MSVARRGVRVVRQLDLRRWLDPLHNRVRAAVAPLGDIAGAVPDGSRVLEIGSGQGLLLRLLAPRVSQCTGVDMDARKCRMARALLQAHDNVRIVEADGIRHLESTDPATLDVVIFCDTLSSLPYPQQERLLELAVRAVRAGGLILVKIMDTEPRAKVLANRAIYVISYRILRASLSEGQRAYYRSAREYADELGRLGCYVAVDVLHRRLHLPLPHTLIVGTRRGDASRVAAGGDVGTSGRPASRGTAS